ncbi:single-stranded DNA-binding protein [Oligella sp. HMSC09E12]|uniref:single-stranded DNA-binding protein n=1 Tax=Oligella sp. HMSC09E12 TaxID=1581147 RepID=UPI0008A4AB42|nr:single-stranded DNA-binding protein [Oligella sp. HMSC09E12]OFV50411.1 single-stranded DNA-binding protein [Oligella sp. HMSC09E12]
MSVNKVILVGRLGADPEARASQSGIQVANLSLATNHVSYDKDGGKNESTEWHRVVFFGRQAEVCEQYLRKGSQVYVEGRIQTRKYTDKDDIERYLTEVIGERLQMLGGREDSQQSSSWASQTKGETASNSYAQAKGRATASSLNELDSDMPF